MLQEAANVNARQVMYLFVQGAWVTRVSVLPIVKGSNITWRIVNRFFPLCAPLSDVKKLGREAPD